MHVEVFEFPLVELHLVFVLECPLSPGILIGRVDVDDLASDLVFKEMHLLSILVHEVTHIQPILQIVVVLPLVIHHDLAYQLVRLLLVKTGDFFA